MTPTGVRIKSNSASPGVAFVLQRWGRTGDLCAPELAEYSYDAGAPEYVRGRGLTEWYLQTEEGLEHGFTLGDRPSGGNVPLQLHITLGVSWRVSVAAGKRDALFVRESCTVTYRGLKAWDSLGRLLDASMRAEGAVLVIEVDDTGARYPITIDPLIGVQEAELIANDNHDNDSFGRKCVISGDTIAIGAPDQEQGPASSFDHGAVYVFRRSGGAWTQEARIFEDPTMYATDDHFGSAVALEQDTLVVGEPFDDEAGAFSDSGSAYVYTRTGTKWNLEQKIVPADAEPFDHFGTSVVVVGDTLAITALNEDDFGIDAGTIYIFERVAGLWSQTAKFSASDIDPSDRLMVGAMDGVTLVARAPDDDTAGLNAGTVYVFRKDPGGWVQEAKLLASDAKVGDGFGTSVDLQGDTLVVGASDAGAGEEGKAYVFQRSAGVWTETHVLPNPEGAWLEDFGISVALDQDRLVVGDHRRTVTATNSGAVYLYELLGGVWVYQHRLEQGDPDSLDLMGNSVDLDGDLVVAGAPGGGDSQFKNSGSAYVFRIEEVFTYYCNPAAANSTGGYSSILAQGSRKIAKNDLRLSCSGMPPSQFGYFLMGDQQSFVPNPGGSAGDLCVGGTLVRLIPPILKSDANGEFSTVIDLTVIPIIGAIQPGETWNFQAWHRDGTTSNFSTAASILFE